MTRPGPASAATAAPRRLGIVATPAVAVSRTFRAANDLARAMAPADFEAATFARLTSVTCVPPPIDLPGGALSSLLEVTLALNGEHFVSATPPLMYRYYAQAISFVHPTGGPVGGGTMVTLRGVGFDAMGDGGASLRCSFGGETSRVELRTIRHVGGEGEGAAGGAGHADGTMARAVEVRCRAPPRRRELGAGAAALSLSLNAHHYLPAPSADFLYYDDPHVYGITPTGGPVLGGTLVTVAGRGFDGLARDAATARCRFGELGEPGRVVSISADGTELVCRAPRPALVDLGCLMPPPPLPPPPPPSAPPPSLPPPLPPPPPRRRCRRRTRTPRTTPPPSTSPTRPSSRRSRRRRRPMRRPWPAATATAAAWGRTARRGPATATASSSTTRCAPTPSRSCASPSTARRSPTRTAQSTTYSPRAAATGAARAAPSSVRRRRRTGTRPTRRSST